MPAAPILALQGIRLILGSAPLLEGAELALTPLYQGQRRWTEIVDWMHDRGFRPVVVKENGIDAAKMRTADLDVLFERMEDT